LGTILLSVSLSVAALWARIKVKKQQSPKIFFSNIADKYPTNEKNIDDQGLKFFNLEIKQKRFSDDFVLQPIARELTGIIFIRIL
jgi:hypothetical protein